MATTKATTLAHTLGGISSDISTAEINRLDGVTGDLQTQLDAKAPLASPDFTGTVDLTGTEPLIKLEDSDSSVVGQGFIDFDGFSLQLNTHRNPITGANNNNKAPASIIMNGNNEDSSISFYTKNSNSGAATKRLGIDKLGSITTPNGEFNGTIGSSATGFGLITMADQWRITANGGDTGTSPAPLTANWERSDDATSGIIGTGMSESSGIFTFPETGIYQVLCSFLLQSRNGDNVQAKAKISVSNDTGSSFDDVAFAESEIDQNDVAQVPIIALVDVTNENTFQVRFSIEASNFNVRVLGSTSNNRTTVSFIRLGDT